MILKSYIIENNISLVDKYEICLFYGENIGLKDDIKNQIRKHYLKHEVINLYGEDILKNNKLLENETYNSSLFNNSKVIFINEIYEKIKDRIFDILENKEKSIKIFIFSKNLEKKSSIRSGFEKNSKLAIIPCYQDTERTLSEYIKKHLRDYKGLNQEMINFLILNCGLDRKILRNEIEKIKVLFLDKTIVTDKLFNLLNYAYNTDFGKLRDTSLSANKIGLNKGLGNTTLQGEDAYFYISSISLRIEKLKEACIQFDKNKNIDLAIENLKPKIFWKDKPIFQMQLKKWNLKKLEIASKAIHNTELMIKTKSELSKSVLIKNLLISLCCQASSSP